jgi:hypothetical protein
VLDAQSNLNDRANKAISQLAKPIAPLLDVRSTHDL